MGESNFFRVLLSCVLVVAAFLCTHMKAQDDPDLQSKTVDEVFAQYVATLDNGVRLHEIGFQATMICDYDSDEKNEPTPKHFRRYGIVADVGNGKLRRIENVGWSITDVGVSWEKGGRLICNDLGSFLQNDPSPIQRIEKTTPGMWINRQSIYSPFGLMWSTIIGSGKGLATPSAITVLESHAKLIGAKASDSKLECLYLTNDHLNAVAVVFDKNIGGMPVEINALWRDKKFAGTDKLKSLTKIDPREISKWLALSKGRVYWQKVTDSKKGDNWVPAIVDIKEQDPASSRRMVYYFVDWKIDKDVDRAIFDHKNFEKTKPKTIYAQMEIAHEYQARQNELDDKVLALKKKFKLD